MQAESVQKGPDIMPETNWLASTGVGIVASVGAWLLSWRINSARVEERIDGMRQDIHELKDDLKATLSDVRAFADASARLQSSQNVVNQGTARSLDIIADKQERLDATVADHTATLRLLTEVVLSKREPKS